MDTENAQDQQQAEPQQQEPVAEPKGEGIDYERLASILDGRQKANEESVLKGYFKEQGLTGEEMAQAISDTCTLLCAIPLQLYILRKISTET